MTIQLKLQGCHITFDQNQVMLGDSRLALLADIPHAVTVQPGRHVAIRTPISFAGDGKTIALLDVHAARLQHSVPEPAESVPGHGSYFLPPLDEEATVVVDVINDTGATFVIHPGHQIGVLTFVNLGGEDAESADEQIYSAAANIGAIYAPSHISPDNLPAYATTEDTGIDLKADLIDPVVIEPNSQATIQTGLTVLPPADLELQVIAPINAPDTASVRLSRSEGPLAIIVQNNSSEPLTVGPADLLAQLIFVPVTRAALIFGRSSAGRRSARN